MMKRMINIRCVFVCVLCMCELIIGWRGLEMIVTRKCLPVLHTMFIESTHNTYITHGLDTI